VLQNFKGEEMCPRAVGLEPSYVQSEYANFRVDPRLAGCLDSSQIHGDLLENTREMEYAARITRHPGE
jgi:hypothetical protein